MPQTLIHRQQIVKERRLTPSLPLEDQIYQTEVARLIWSPKTIVSRDEKRRRRMDGNTAISFAAEVFAELHPRATFPSWLNKCGVLCWSRDSDGNFIVSITLTPKATGVPTVLFQALVDQHSGETKLCVDHDLASLQESDYQGN